MLSPTLSLPATGNKLPKDIRLPAPMRLTLRSVFLRISSGLGLGWADESNGVVEVGELGWEAGVKGVAGGVALDCMVWFGDMRVVWGNSSPKMLGFLCRFIGNFLGGIRGLATNSLWLSNFMLALLAQDFFEPAFWAKDSRRTGVEGTSFEREGGDDKGCKVPAGTDVALVLVLCFLARSTLTFSSSSEEAHDVIESRLSWVTGFLASFSCLAPWAKAPYDGARFEPSLGDLLSLGGGGGGISALIRCIRGSASGALLPLVIDIDDVVETDDTDRRMWRERAKVEYEAREVSVDELGVVGGGDRPNCRRDWRVYES